MTLIHERSFGNRKKLKSIWLNTGLERLEEMCFRNTGIKTLVLPASVTNIEHQVFKDCASLRYTDLRAAHKLKHLGNELFSGCITLKHVLLNEGLETISRECFR